MPQLLHDVGLSQEVLRIHRAGLECLNGDRCGVVPQPLPHFPELSVSQLPHKLEAGALYLPLVPRVVTQVRCRGLLNLEFVCQVI